MSTPTSTIDSFLLKGTPGSGSTVTWSILCPIKEYPDLGGSPEAIDVTTLSDHIHKTVPGIQDIDALEFTANYDPTDYEAVNALSGTETQFAVAFGKSENSYGGTGLFQFKGDASAYVTSGSVNDAREMTITINLSSEIDFSTTAVTVS